VYGVHLCTFVLPSLLCTDFKGKERNCVQLSFVDAVGEFSAKQIIIVGLVDTFTYLSLCYNE